MSLLICAALCVGADPLTHTKDPVTVIKKNLKAGKAVLLDVREKREWDDGHLARAKLVPLTVFGDQSKLKQALRAAGAKPRMIVYTHCGAGVRALMAGKTLKKMGFDVRPLKAGYDDLLKQGFSKAR